MSKMCGFSNEQNRGIACYVVCIQGLIHAAETRDSQCMLHGKIPKQGPDQHQGIHTCTPSPAVPALRHIYLEWHNEMRSTLGLLPHQSVGGPPAEMDATLDGDVRRCPKPAHVISIKSQYHNSINIKCNASTSNTAVVAPHGMPLVNLHGHLTLTKMEAHGAERRIIW